MLRNTPPGEDPLKNTRAVPVSVQAVAMPPGEDGVTDSRAAPELENMAASDAAARDSAFAPALSTSAQAVPSGYLSWPC